MLAKQYRLTGKDINFLVKKRHIIYAGLFVFHYYKQYPNRQFNQISVNISTKVDKRATKRNVIKRIVLDYIYRNKLHTVTINNKHYKILVSINKRDIEQIKEKIASNKKNDIIDYILGEFIKAKGVFARKALSH